MNFIAWIILGLIAGAIAKAILPGNDPGGFIVTIIIGIIGSVLGGFLAQQVFDVSGEQGFFNPVTWIVAILGAILLLVIYRLVTGRRAT